MTSRTDAGSALPALQGPVLDRARLAAFAAGSGDLNPIHVDTDFARAAGYDDVFAHGMLSMALLARLLTSWTGQDRLRSLKARFVARTPVHAEPVCTGTVVAVVERGGERLATVALQVALADGTVTVTGEAVVALDGPD